MPAISKIRARTSNGGRDVSTVFADTERSGRSIRRGSSRMAVSASVSTTTPSWTSWASRRAPPILLQCGERSSKGLIDRTATPWRSMWRRGSECRVPTTWTTRSDGSTPATWVRQANHRNASRWNRGWLSTTQAMHPPAVPDLADSSVAPSGLIASASSSPVYCKRRYAKFETLRTGRVSLQLTEALRASRSATSCLFSSNR